MCGSWSHHLRVLVFRAEACPPVGHAVSRVLVAAHSLAALVVDVNHAGLLVLGAKLSFFSRKRCGTKLHTRGVEIEPTRADNRQMQIHNTWTREEYCHSTVSPPMAARMGCMSTISMSQGHMRTRHGSPRLEPSLHEREPGS